MSTIEDVLSVVKTAQFYTDLAAERIRLAKSQNENFDEVSFDEILDIGSDFRYLLARLNRINDALTASTPPATS